MVSTLSGVILISNIRNMLAQLGQFLFSSAKRCCCISPILSSRLIDKPDAIIIFMRISLIMLNILN